MNSIKPQQKTKTKQTESDIALQLSGVSKYYDATGEKLVVFEGLDFAVKSGEMVGLIAPSGAGKSTLLHLAGLLDSPSSGMVSILGQATGNLADKDKTRLRSEKIGFVYQFHHLLPELTALENVALPQRINGRTKKQANERAEKLLTFMGLSERQHHRPFEMSGGEQQRTAIARAMANNPAILLADEPTGNLDPETAETVFQVLRKMISATGRAALIATHNHDLAHRMDRCVTLTRNGIIPVKKRAPRQASKETAKSEDNPEQKGAS